MHKFIIGTPIERSHYPTKTELTARKLQQKLLLRLLVRNGLTDSQEKINQKFWFEFKCYNFFSSVYRSSSFASIKTVTDSQLKINENERKQSSGSNSSTTIFF